MLLSELHYQSDGSCAEQIAARVSRPSRWCDWRRHPEGVKVRRLFTLAFRLLHRSLRNINAELDMRFLLWYFILSFKGYHICGSLISNYQLPSSKGKAESESNRLSPSVKVQHLEMSTSCLTNWGVLGLHKDNFTFSISEVSAEAWLRNRFFSDETAHRAVGLWHFEGAQCLHIQGSRGIAHWPYRELGMWMTSCGADS
jgi:hypothetical protein